MANRQAAIKVKSRISFMCDSPFRCLWTIQYARRGDELNVIRRITIL
jgi:hypothetical protein